ncbi:hypothetical protein ACLIMP_09375 [Novosphingobium aerophilum]|uniref:hypothetical protein n=1 Tax=Novosphingobium TaxID=165696 RepID=UPI002D797BCF|nr:hypothetical protein [Novosphingobium sp. RL4]WRT94571.1 hypothetical protein U9J33_08740 [Novosphingobium sp. RL4]
MRPASLPRLLFLLSAPTLAALPGIAAASRPAPDTHRATGADSAASLTPITLAPGVNPMPDIAGTDQDGSIAQLWRQNNKIRGQHVFLVKVGDASATLEGRESIIDAPDVGDDMIRSVRFARGNHEGRTTLYMLIASRDVEKSPYKAATTHIQSFALVRNHEGFAFTPVLAFVPAAKYCHADAALLAELNFPLSPTYAGRVTPTGC